MNKTFYEILGVDKAASPELLAEAYKLSLKKCEERLNSGDLNRQNELVLIKEAYRTLADPDKRKFYDATLPSMGTASSFYPHTAQPGSGPHWWSSSKTSLLLAGIFLLLAGYLVLGYIQASGSKQVASESVSVESMRATNEARLVDGVIRHEEQALDQRANAEAQLIEMQRQAQEARLEMERERQERLDRQMEVDRLEREKRYYSCLNGAIDRVGVAEASGYCSKYR